MLFVSRLYDNFDVLPKRGEKSISRSTEKLPERFTHQR